MNKGLQFSEFKNNWNVEPESSGQQVQQEIKEIGEVEQEFLVREEIKEKWDAKQDSSVEEIQQEIKEKPKDSDGVTNDLHIELNIFPCTAS